MNLVKQRPSYYDVDKWGVPINDLDSIATITTFSATLIWLSLPRQGIWMRQQEIEDYTALWRYIAYLTGTPTGPFESPQKARRYMQVLMLYEIRPSLTSRVLANNVISSLKDRSPNFASKEFLEVNTRWLNGNKLADELGIGRPSLYYWALMAGQCLFFMTLVYTYRSIPFLDRRKIRVSLSSLVGSGVADVSERLCVKYFGKSSSRATWVLGRRQLLNSSTFQISLNTREKKIS